ncbi:MAG: YihY/virulence factor BrkB family protein [Hyphomonas sp.]
MKSSLKGPFSLSGKQWLVVLNGVRSTAERSNLALISAGVAFFGLMAAIPGLAALMAIVGIVGEPQWVGEQVQALRGLAPDAVVSIIHGQVDRLLGAAEQSLLAGAVFNLLLAIWSALQGTRWVIVALSAIHNYAPPRKFIRRYLAAGRFTLFGLGLGAVAILLLGIAPILFTLIPLDGDAETFLLMLRWPVLGGCAIGFLLILYRWGPAGAPPAWKLVWPGAVLAPALWLAASSVLTFALREFPAFGAAYGALASVVALLLWLYLSSLIFLLGAAFNAELQRINDPPEA